MNEQVLQKLKVLAESAKYDVSCASSGTVRRNSKGGVGNTVGGWGICHSFAEDGRCISLLKIMLTNYCQPHQQRHSPGYPFCKRTGGPDHGILPA